MSEESTFYDFLIVGAGIAGCSLALELHQRGKKVCIFDLNNPNSSSRTAAGMMNPMVPRNVQKAWKCDQIYPQVYEYYEAWEQRLGTKFIHRIPTLQVHKNASHTKNWTQRAKEKGFQHHLSPVAEENNEPYSWGLPLPYGAAICHLSGKLDVSTYLDACYRYFDANGITKINETFDYQQLEPGNGWMYQGFSFSHLICAEGIGLYQNPYFNYLPLGATGGDILELEIHGLSEEYILKRKEWLIPIGNHRWLGGSTYHNEDMGTVPEPQHAEALLSLFREWIPHPIRLIGHRKAARPTVSTWRPFLGKHPEHDGMYVYNGLGSKGSSLVSYLSPRYADFLCGGSELPEEVNIARFV